MKNREIGTVLEVKASALTKGDGYLHSEGNNGSRSGYC